MSSVNAGVAQLVERQLSKLNVAGSNPVSRSRKARQPPMPARSRQRGALACNEHAARASLPTSLGLDGCLAFLLLGGVVRPGVPGGACVASLRSSRTCRGGSGRCARLGRAGGAGVAALVPGGLVGCTRCVLGANRRGIGRRRLSAPRGCHADAGGVASLRSLAPGRREASRCCARSRVGKGRGGGRHRVAALAREGGGGGGGGRFLSAGVVGWSKRRALLRSSKTCCPSSSAGRARPW